MDNKQLVKYLNLIHSISRESQQALDDISYSVSIEKNNDLQPVGHTCRTLYYVVKGALRVYYYKDGIDITESFEFENSIVARAESLFSGRPSRKAIQAIEDTELVAINASKLFALYDTHPDLERLFRKVFEEAYVKTVNRIESLQFHTAEERYQNLLKDQPDVLLRVPLKHVASYLGITQVSLSRIRARK
jgi:CRP-like cAMP-binding protein